MPVPPFIVTDSSIVRSVRAVVASMTSMPLGCLFCVCVAGRRVIEETMRGGMRTPSLAIVW